MITMNNLTKGILKTLIQCNFMNTLYLRKMSIEDIIKVFSSKSEYDQAVSNLEKNDGDCKYILLSELEMIWNNLQ